MDLSVVKLECTYLRGAKLGNVCLTNFGTLMQKPNFKLLDKEIQRKGFHIISYAAPLHPNPQFYKYYWWVFYQNSPCDGDKFLRKQYRLPIKKAFDLMSKLKNTGQSYWLYNTCLPRFDPSNMPFEPKSERWRNIEWALSFDEDTDEEYQGFK